MQTEGWGRKGTEWRQGERSGRHVIIETITQAPPLGTVAWSGGGSVSRDVSWEGEHDFDDSRMWGGVKESVKELEVSVVWPLSGCTGVPLSWLSNG